MKKLISIIAALSMIASLGVTSFAAIDASVSDAATGTTLSYSEGTFTAGITGNASQNTIVVVKGDGSDISTTSIEYINQDAASQNFNFVLKNTPDAEEDFTEGNTLTYTVLMGGDKVEKTTVGTITYTYTKDVVYYTVIFKDANGETLSTAEYEENATVVIPADQTKAENENYTYTFEGWKVEGAEDSTAVKTGITATGNLTYVPVFSATQKEVGGGEEDEYTLGDVFVDEEVNDVDIMLLQYYYAELFDDIDTVFGEGHKFWEDETDPRNKAADVFTDGEINDVDIMLLQYYYAELFDDIDAVFGEGHKFWE